MKTWDSRTTATTLLVLCVGAWSCGRAGAAAIPDIPAMLALQGSLEMFAAAISAAQNSMDAAVVDGLRALADFARAAIEMQAVLNGIPPVSGPAPAGAASASLKPSTSSNTTDSGDSSGGSGGILGLAGGLITGGQQLFQLATGFLFPK